MQWRVSVDVPGVGVLSGCKQPFDFLDAAILCRPPQLRASELIDGRFSSFTRRGGTGLPALTPPALQPKYILQPQIGWLFGPGSRVSARGCLPLETSGGDADCVFAAVFVSVLLSIKRGQLPLDFFKLPAAQRSTMLVPVPVQHVGATAAQHRSYPAVGKNGIDAGVERLIPVRRDKRREEIPIGVHLVIQAPIISLPDQHGSHHSVTDAHFFR